MANVFEHFRKIAIYYFEDALKKHEAKDYLLIADNIDKFEALLDVKEIAQGSNLHLALEFLSCWGDSAAHDWYHYEPLKKEDWPRMGKIILNDLKANREISDPEILYEFYYVVEPEVSIITKIKTLFKNTKT